MSKPFELDIPKIEVMLEHLLYCCACYPNRFAVRHVLRMITRDSASMDNLLSQHLSSLKRLLFPKSLRTLPLPNQCAIVDACAFLLNRAPTLIAITDPNLLAFLAELLKMISIADGEFSDPAFGSVVLIDKNGIAVDKSGESPSQNGHTRHPSSVFLRKSTIIEDSFFGGRVQVPEELPQGVQLRVSTLLLFRGLIRAFSDAFYDADPQSKVGNIRPHVSESTDLFFVSNFHLKFVICDMIVT